MNQPASARGGRRQRRRLAAAEAVDVFGKGSHPATAVEPKSRGTERPANRARGALSPPVNPEADRGKPASPNLVTPGARADCRRLRPRRHQGVAGQQGQFSLSKGSLLSTTSRQPLWGGLLRRAAAAWPGAPAAQAFRAESAPARPAVGPAGQSAPAVAAGVGASSNSDQGPGGGLRWRRPGQISAARSGRRRLQGTSNRLGQASSALIRPAEEAACAAWGVSWAGGRKSQIGQSGWGMWVEGSSSPRANRRPRN